MALIKFVQDDNEGDDGEALLGDLDDPVQVSQSASDTTPIGSWEISLLDLPFDSELTLGVIAQANGGTPAASFQPDVAGGCYRVMLRTWPQANRQGRVDVDIRNFGVLGSNGFLPPPSMIWPEPLPDPRTGRPGAKPNELNFDGQLHGWSGLGNDGMLRHLILALTLGAAPPIFGSGSDGPHTASSGTLTLTRDTYFTAIDLSGTAKIDTAGFKLYASASCRIVGSAQVLVPARHGADAVLRTGGAGGATPPAGSTLDQDNVGQGAGANGQSAINSSNTAGSPQASATVAVGWGGRGGSAGGVGGDAWGIGSSGVVDAGAVTAQISLREVVVDDLLAVLSGGKTPVRIRAGSGGCCGRNGSTNPFDNPADADKGSGGGGGGGGAGGVVCCYFRKLITDATTQPGAISAKGGDGGDGADAGPANSVVAGGGGGGSGGGGGAVYLIVGEREGPVVVGLVDISGGDGGSGGDGDAVDTTSGGSKACGGSGGGGGESGQAFAYNISTGDFVLSRWANAVTSLNPVTATNPPNLVGVAGTPATVTRLTF